METSPTRGSATVRVAAAPCVVTESFHAPLLEQPEIHPVRTEGRRDQLQRGCEITLANLKAALERR